MRGLRENFSVREVDVIDYQVPALDVGIVAPPTPVAPPLPTIQLIEPEEGQTFLLPDLTIGLQALVVRNGNHIIQVEFFVDGVSIGTDADTFYPFTAEFSPEEPGSYTLQAKLTYGDDVVIESNEIVIIVTDPWADMTWESFVANDQGNHRNVVTSGVGNGGVWNMQAHDDGTDGGSTGSLGIRMEGSLSYTYGPGLKHHSIHLEMVNGTGGSIWGNQVDVYVDGVLTVTTNIVTTNSTVDFPLDLTYTGTPLVILIRALCTVYSESPNNHICSISGTLAALD